MTEPIAPLNLGHPPRFDLRAFKDRGAQYLEAYLKRQSDYSERAFSDIERQDEIRNQADSAKAWTITNDNTDRTFDADSTSVAELADVLATLIKDLQDKGILP